MEISGKAENRRTEDLDQLRTSILAGLAVEARKRKVERAWEMKGGSSPRTLLFEYLLSARHRHVLSHSIDKEIEDQSRKAIHPKSPSEEAHEMGCEFSSA